MTALWDIAPCSLKFERVDEGFLQPIQEEAIHPLHAVRVSSISMASQIIWCIYLDLVHRTLVFWS
jgi:hypothetical protein